eukprot:6859203-Prymnesium_polylepis.2
MLEGGACRTCHMWRATSARAGVGRESSSSPTPLPTVCAAPCSQMNGDKSKSKKSVAERAAELGVKLAVPKDPNDPKENRA